MKAVSNLFHKAAAAFSQPKPVASQPPAAGPQPKVPDRKSLASESPSPVDPGAPAVTQRKASTLTAGSPVVTDTKSSSTPAASPVEPLGLTAVRELGWQFNRECLARGALVTIQPERDAEGQPVEADEAYPRKIATLVREMPQARQPEVAARLVETSRDRLNLLIMHAAPDFARAVDTLLLDRLYKDHNLGATLVGLCHAGLDPDGLKTGLRFIESSMEGAKVSPLLDHEKAAFLRYMASTLRESLTGEAQAQSLGYLKQATLATASQAGAPRLLANWDDSRERTKALEAAGLA